MHRLGAPHDALELDDIDLPVPGPGCTQVAVEAVGLNHPDLLLCAGRYQERPELPFSPGFEATGVVTRSGPGSAHRPGDRVIVIPELPSGAMQSTLTVPDAQVYPAPVGTPAAIAAVLHIAYATAHAALHRRAALRPGETVLVSGAGGGVGIAAVQIARASGARVIGLATGHRKLGAVRAAGADAAVDLGDVDDLVATLRHVTGGRGADVVLDVVGGDVFHALRRCVAFEGRLVTVGFAGGDVPGLPVNHALLRNYSVVGLHLARYRTEAPEVLRTIHDEVVALAESGHVDPPIHASLPFEQAPEALDLLARREVIGRVVLTL